MGTFSFTNLTRRIEIGANSFVLDIAGKRIILDSGLHPRSEGENALPQLSLVEAGSVDAIFVSHAHQDHVGSLPLVMRRHPGASVFMTEATRRLSDVMLHNSVNVMLKQRDDGLLANALFTHREVDSVSRRWQPVALRQRFDVQGERVSVTEQDGLTFEFFDAGHILGSVGTLIRAAGRTIFYTGDVQFEDQSVMQGARFPEEPLDVLIIETTRGDRATPEGFTRAGEEARLAHAIKKAFGGGGAVLIPVFALGKTQELLAMLHGFRRKGLLDMCPIYIGGLGTKLTEIYDKLAHETPRQNHKLQILDDVAPFTMAGKAADDVPLKSGRIYAISSGMMTEKTLSNSFARKVLSDPQHSVFFVGYADPASPAGRIRAAAPGEMVQLSEAFPPQPLHARVEPFNFSAHASRETLRAYVNKVRPKKVVLVHGDETALEWFRATLQGDLPESEIIVPTPGVAIEL